MDITERLRQRVLHGDARLLNPQGHDPISMKAADEIERLRQENERLRKFIKEHDMAEVLEDWENS